MSTLVATNPESATPYLMTVKQVCQWLQTDITKGLNHNVVTARLAEHGENTLGTEAAASMFSVFMSNLINPMNVIVVLALGLSCIVKDWVQVVALGFVIAVNTIVGFLQESKSESTMAALKKMSSPSAKVIRNGGKLETISSLLVVPGDIVIFEEGDQIPADLRIFESVNLSVDEMMLTGESVPVEKSTAAISLDSCDDGDVSLGDRANLAFNSTTVTRGRGRGIVVATGLRTEVGRIAQLLKSQDDDDDDDETNAKRSAFQRFARRIPGVKGRSTKTPLQKSLERMMYSLVPCAMIFALFVFWSANWEWSSGTALYAVIAIIPEGLPAVVTVTMAVGVRKMAKEKAIVRKINALEALGMISNICSDKTGTLTIGKMTAQELWIAGERYLVNGTGVNPTNGGVSLDAADGGRENELTADSINESPILDEFFTCAALCNQSTLEPPEDPTSADQSKPEWSAIGDPTEIALQVLAHRVHMQKIDLISRKRLDFVAELAFDSTLKRMTTLYAEPSRSENTWRLRIHMKGALERVMDQYADFEALAIREMERLADKGYRVLALAHREETITGSLPVIDVQDGRGAVEQNFVFLGLVGIFDPPRESSAPAIRTCFRAGIDVHMATGDHARTAAAIAKQIGIFRPGEEKDGVWSAHAFDKLSDDQIDALPRLPVVISRCAPKTKVRLVAALHRRGKFVAMTGDGTNDAPALKAADVGVAMGLTGSDVAKNASDIVLTDDEFGTIVAAVREGRRMFENITKFSMYFLCGNVAEVIAMVVGLAVRGSDSTAYFPMSALSVLYINMITSTPVAIFMVNEKASRTVMSKPPRGHPENQYAEEIVADSSAGVLTRAPAASASSVSSSTSMFTTRFLLDALFYGTVAGSLSLGAFVISMAFTDRGLNGYDASRCNDHSSTFVEAECSEIYEARGIAFMVLNATLLVHG
ncbi:Na+ ATPase [Geranomyces variabilis]|nr:Na+ ATPase [Geranomyces variabilis]